MHDSTWLLGTAWFNSGLNLSTDLNFQGRLTESQVRRSLFQDLLPDTSHSARDFYSNTRDRDQLQFRDHRPVYERTRTCKFKNMFVLLTITVLFQMYPHSMTSKMILSMTGHLATTYRLKLLSRLRLLFMTYLPQCKPTYQLK